MRLAGDVWSLSRKKGKTFFFYFEKSFNPPWCYRWFWSRRKFLVQSYSHKLRILITIFSHDFPLFLFFFFDFHYHFYFDTLKKIITTFSLSSFYFSFIIIIILFFNFNAQKLEPVFLALLDKTHTSTAGHSQVVPV